MESRLNEFRKFVSTHPLLREEVRNGKRTWQSIYEEWYLYDNSEDWKKYENINKEEKKESLPNKILKMDNMKNVFGYVKKINPDSLNKTLNNVQKVIQIAQTVGGTKAAAVPAAASVFSDWWE